MGPLGLDIPSSLRHSVAPGVLFHELSCPDPSIEMSCHSFLRYALLHRLCNIYHNPKYLVLLYLCLLIICQLRYDRNLFIF